MLVITQDKTPLLQSTKLHVNLAVYHVTCKTDTNEAERLFMVLCGKDEVDRVGMKIHFKLQKSVEDI